MIRNNGIPIMHCISKARVKIFMTEKRFVNISNLRASFKTTVDICMKTNWNALETIIFQAIRVLDKKTFPQNRKPILFKYY